MRTFRKPGYRAFHANAIVESSTKEPIGMENNADQPVVNVNDVPEAEPELAAAETNPGEDKGDDKDKGASSVGDSKATDKIMSYVAVAIEKNKSKVLPLLKSKTGEASLAALKEDANVEKLARVVYALLPGVVRFALKEQVFVQFMLDNRSKLLDKLIQDEALQLQP